MIRSGIRLTKTRAPLPTSPAPAHSRAGRFDARFSGVLWAATLFATTLAATSGASAQQTEPAVPSDAPTATAEPSAQQRQAAAEAYDRGTAAYLARDYVNAARWFETAHRMAPAAPALLQAVRANQRGGNTLRASNLALRLQTQYPRERQALRVADPLVSAANRAFLRVDVTCAGCTVDLDGTLQEWTSFYLEPGADHVVGAHFETGDAEAQHVNGAAGAQQALTFTAPPPPPEPVAVVEPRHGWPANALRHHDGAATDDDPGAAGESGGTHGARTGASGLSPIVFLASAAATVVAGGVLIWSGVDTTAGVADYEANPTQAALDAGQSKELRTNILIAATGVLGATTLVFALLTNWSGQQEAAPPAVEATITPVAGGAVGVLGGRF